MSAIPTMAATVLRGLRSRLLLSLGSVVLTALAVVVPVLLAARLMPRLASVVSNDEPDVEVVVVMG